MQDIENWNLASNLYYHFYIQSVITQSFIWKYQLPFAMCWIFLEYHVFANFTTEMIGKKQDIYSNVWSATENLSIRIKSSTC